MRKENLLKERKLFDGVQKIYKFDNGYGASVVKHSFSYGHELDQWELALVTFDKENNIQIEYNPMISDDVIGNLEEYQVDDILEKIKNSSSIYQIVS